MLEEERLRQEEKQRQEIENSRNAVASQLARDPWEVHREHHDGGLKCAQQFLTDYQAACPGSRALDFAETRKLQKLLGFHDFGDVQDFVNSLNDRALAFMTALEAVTLGDKSTEYKDRRYRYFVLYLAASRSEALGFLDETFGPLISEEERRWIEMLRIAGVEASKSLTLTLASERTFEVQYSEGLRTRSCAITGDNIEVVEQWAQNINPVKVLIASSQQAKASDQRKARERKALQQRLKASLVSKLDTIGLEVVMKPVYEDKNVIGYELTLPADIEVRIGAEKK